MSENSMRPRSVSPSINPEDSTIDSRANTSPDDTHTSSDRSFLPLPRFMQDERTSKYCGWVPYPVKRFGRWVAQWSKGPPNPKNFKINPLLPAVQEAPLRFMDKFLPQKSFRIALYLFWVSMWIIAFALVMWKGLGATEIPGYGTPTTISCGAVYWSSDNECGIDGMYCRPFNGSSFAFRCPGNCISYQALNPVAVGTSEVIYQPLVVGGPSDPATGGGATYRGDSFICGSAIHAGVISNTAGGCGVVEKVGEQSQFTGSNRNGISSVGFDSYFPLSVQFAEGVQCEASDPRWSLLAISVVFSTVLGLFTADPGVFFFTVFIGAFWQVGLASDPPSSGDIVSLFSELLGRFLPYMFCGWVIFDKMGVRRTLRGLTAQIEKVFLWLGGCWVGALSNYTFEEIPLERLTGHDLQQQPGAKTALAVIVIVLFCIIVTQVWFFRQEGRLLKYLQLYALFILGIIICLVLPSLNLRIHHYILALLLLPGTSMQTRPCLLYQGILIGLFVNGIARWDFASVLETSAALQGDAQYGSALPVVLAPVINATLATISFQWEPRPSPKYDGISILVNDVERYRKFFDDPDSQQFVWEREPDSNINEYFRFAYMSSTTTMDYTKAGTWDTQLNWIPMEAGPSKIKRGMVDNEEEELLPKALR